MNETLPPQPPPPARPFAPEQTSGGSGCQKPLLIGCGLLSLLLGIAAVVFVVKAKDVLAYAMNQLRMEVVAHLPKDAPATDRQRVEEGFDAALSRIRSGELDPAALQELQKKLTAAASAAATRDLTREELDGLVTALDLFNGTAAESAPPETSPTEESPAAEPQSTPEPSSGGAGTTPGAADPARPPAP